jgi:hypothetical protein
VPNDANTSDPEVIITFERYWAHQLNRIKEQAEKTEQEGQ